MGPEPGIPGAERLFPLAVQHPCANLQQEMGAAWGPLHLLFFHHALAHDLIHRRFDKARADTLAVVVALAIIRNKPGIVADLGVKLLDGFEEFPSRPIAARRHGDLQIHDRRLHHLQGLIDIPMPQEPFEPFERPPHRLTDVVRALVIRGGLR